MLDLRVCVGRLTKDPEVRVISDDVSVCSFTVAVDGDYKGKDGEKKTEFVDCKAWRNNAKFLEDYGAKGRLVCVVGRCETDQWEDDSYHNKDGEPVVRRKNIVTVDKVYFLDSKKDKEEEEPAATSKGKQSSSSRPPKW